MYGLACPCLGDVCLSRSHSKQRLSRELCLRWNSVDKISITVWISQKIPDSRDEILQYLIKNSYILKFEVILAQSVFI